MSEMSIEYFGPMSEVSGHFGPKSTRHFGPKVRVVQQVKLNPTEPIPAFFR